MQTLSESEREQEIENLSEQGNAFMEAEAPQDALHCFCQALELVDEPLETQEAATWLFASIGDACFQLQQWDKALDALTRAVRCPGGLGNPFIHLSLGQAQYERGNLDKAADELTRAYMGAGEDIFQEDNPEYFEFLKSRIELS